MADLTRLYNFIAGQIIKASEVNEELNQLIARIGNLQTADLGDKIVNEAKLFPQNGLVVGSQGLSVGASGAYSDWASGSVTFTPALACFILAVLEVHGDFAAQDNTTDGKVEATIGVDGADESRSAAIGYPRSETGNNSGMKSGVMLYRVPLTGGVPHTVKIRRRKTSLPAGVGKATGVGAELFWLLVAS